jgi:hypothetical protein
VKRALLLLTVGLLAVAGTGCSGGGEASPEEYAEAVVSARDRTDFALERIVNAGSEEELINRMEEASVQIDDAASDLDGVGVPADYKPEGDQLVTHLNQLAFDVGAVANDLQQPGFEDILDPTRGLSFESWDKVNLALAGLNGKGIPVVILQPHAPRSSGS